MPLITPDIYKPHAEKHEGRIPWMYLDSVGVVTIGIGCALPMARAAKSLPLLVRGRLATFQEIQTDYVAVKGAAGGKNASYYKRFTVCRLRDQEIDELFERDCDEKIDALSGKLFGQHGLAFGALPSPAQLALLDMAYNLGGNALVTKWPRLMAAVQERDWAVCAAECNRPQLSAERNVWTHGQFMLAADLDLAARAGANPPPQPAPPGPRAPAVTSGPPVGGGPRPEPRASESPKPLTHSRTMIGSAIAALSTAATTVFDQGYGWLNTIQEWTGELHGLSEPLTTLAPTLASMKGALLALALAGVAYAIYARWDDRQKKGH